MYSWYFCDRLPKQHRICSAVTGRDKPAWRGTGEYYANISYMDERVGKVLDKIKAMKITLCVIFTSDNGLCRVKRVGMTELAGETDVRAGVKTTCGKGGIRVPAIIKCGSTFHGDGNGRTGIWS